MPCNCSPTGKDRPFKVVKNGRKKTVMACCQSCAEGKPCESHQAPTFSLQPRAEVVEVFSYDNSDRLILDDNGGGRLGQASGYTINTPAGPLELPIRRIPTETGSALYVPGGCDVDLVFAPVAPLTIWVYVGREDFEGNPIPGSGLEEREPIPGGVDPSFPGWPCPPGILPREGGGFYRSVRAKPEKSPWEWLGEGVDWLKNQFSVIGGEVFEGGVLTEEAEALPFAPILETPAPQRAIPPAPAPLRVLRPAAPPAIRPRIQPVSDPFGVRPDPGPALQPAPKPRMPIQIDFIDPIRRPAPELPAPEAPARKSPGILPLVGLLAWSLLQ
jgi:hypothetical protein